MTDRATTQQRDIDSLERGRGTWKRLAGGAARAAPPIALLALLLLIWQVAVVARGVPDYLLPAPSGIWQTTLQERDLLLSSTVPTLEIAVAGFALALVLGAVLAVAIHRSRVIELSLYPIVIASQTIPVTALAPILVVLLGFTVLPRLIIVFLICFFPIIVNTVDGFRSVDPDLVNLMRTLGAGRLRMFRDVEWPTALPYLFSGAKVAATYSVVGELFSEWAGSSEGLGYLMQQKSAQLDTAVVFSAMVILSLIGIGLFVLIALSERLLLPWYHDERRRDALGR